MIHLYGSTTSPFVRRIRILLDERPYEFHPASMFNESDRDAIIKNNPAGKVPYLIDSEANVTIWDSALIANYLHEKFKISKGFALEEQKQLILINEITDSAILLFQFRKFKLDETWSHSISQRFQGRIDRIIDLFEASPPAGHEAQNTVANWLYCFLDWTEFREVYNLKPKHPALQKFKAQYSQHAIVKKTDPRLS